MIAEGDGIMIRAARLSDVPELARVHVDAWDMAGAPSPSIDRRLELWYHVLGGGARRSQVWVALDGLGGVVGFSSAGKARTLRARYDAELTAVYVAPPARRRGIGRALVEQAFGWFAARKLASAMAWVPEAGPARDFLAELGAIPTEDRRLSRAGGEESQSLAEIAMEWRLTR